MLFGVLQPCGEVVECVPSESSEVCYVVKQVVGVYDFTTFDDDRGRRAWI